MNTVFKITWCNCCKIKAASLLLLLRYSSVILNHLPFGCIKETAFENVSKYIIHPLRTFAEAPAGVWHESVSVSLNQSISTSQAHTHTSTTRQHLVEWHPPNATSPKSAVAPDWLMLSLITLRFSRDVVCVCVWRLDSDSSRHVSFGLDSCFSWPVAQLLVLTAQTHCETSVRNVVTLWTLTALPAA